MAFLLDTDILSATRRRKRHTNLETWLRSLHPSEVFISAITIGEIEKGIEKQRNSHPEFATDLANWLDKLLAYYGGQILPITTDIARRWGKLSQQLGHANVDILIAATAWQHGLTVATGNTRHFEPTGVKTINPLDPD